MGYIKKEYREILEKMDYMDYLPRKWDEFVSKQEEQQNLLIKKGNQCICTNCKHIFKSNKKVKQTEKCPYCKNTYTIKRSNLKNYTFIDDLAFLDKVDGKFVLRIYELRSTYNNISKYYGFNRSIVEYARIIPEEHNATFVNERVSKCQCYIHVNHWLYARQMEITHSLLQCC